MSGPLWQAAQDYLARDCSRFHMPGHKGLLPGALAEVARLDLTEVTGMDSLYHAHGAIARTEADYTELYGTAASLLSAGGSTLCIQAMLALAVPPGGKIILSREVHTAAVNALALLDLRPVWVYPRPDPVTGLPGPLSPEAVSHALKAHPDAAAVYVTSPTYYGVISDIAAIKQVCLGHKVPLLVDNAHGSHLRFTRPSRHPVDAGADLCCDSLHKTLPVLTGGALLHVCNPAYTHRAKGAMALFGSTSPSYPIMLSADLALEYLRTRLPGDMERVSARLEDIAGIAREKGLTVPESATDPLRLTLGFFSAGYTREDFAAHLARYQMEPEYLDRCWCVLMATGSNPERDFRRLEELLAHLKPGMPLGASVPIPQPGPAALSPREAAFAASEALPVADSLGRIASAMAVPCPPGIPLVVPGERITEEMLPVLEKGGICILNVVK